MGSGELDGRSMLGLTQGETDWYKDVNYSEYHGDWNGHYSQRMVTDGRWKLVWNLSDLCELYDLQEDPHELTNLFYDPPIARPATSTSTRWSLRANASTTATWA